MNRLGLTLLIICLLDLIRTALGIHFGYLEELNPMLNYFLVHWGLSGFILAKLFFVVVPILVLETVSKIQLLAQERIRFYYKIAISAYVLILGGGILFQLITA